MKIGFDAKRVFFNNSGLGNYSRGVVWQMANFYPENDYTLFSPKPGNRSGFELPQGVRIVYPESFLNRKASSLWRSFNMCGSIKSEGIELFHGLSNELPSDIRKSGARSVLTMHDIIFVHFPELYKPFDRWMYEKKYLDSCRKADRIIAISIQTKDDLINHWAVPEEKIDVVYQGCNPMFYDPVSEEAKDAVRKKYSLPDRYVLSVGTIEERKNLLLTVKAIAEGRIDIDLVACGRSTPYAEEIRSYALRNGIANRVHLIHNACFEDLPAIYQMSEVMVYASLYEGFGIPILEGMNSGVPVITSKGGVFPETGGDACEYVDPHSTEEMVAALMKSLDDTAARHSMIERGKKHALLFRDKAIAENILNVYKKTL